MRTLRTRAEDGPRGFFAKLAASVLSALLVAAVVWNFTTIIATQGRVDHIEWWAKDRGIMP